MDQQFCCVLSAAKNGQYLKKFIDRIGEHRQVSGSWLSGFMKKCWYFEGFFFCFIKWTCYLPVTSIQKNWIKHNFNGIDKDARNSCDVNLAARLPAVTMVGPIKSTKSYKAKWSHCHSMIHRIQTKAHVFFLFIQKCVISQEKKFACLICFSWWLGDR